MMNMRTIHRFALISVFVAVAGFAASAHASDAYFVGFDARGQGIILWRDAILFYNTGTAPTTVRFLELSNGGTGLAPLTLVLPPGKTVSLYDQDATGDRWQTRHLPPVPLWVLHLDVPDGVIVESRSQFFQDPQFGGFMFPAPWGRCRCRSFGSSRPRASRRCTSARISADGTRGST